MIKNEVLGRIERSCGYGNFRLGLEINLAVSKFSKLSKMRFWAELGGLKDTVQFVSVRRLIWRGRQSSYPQIFNNQDFTHHHQPT